MLTKKNERRSGVAATETAILMPLVCLMFAVAVDWSRIFYYSVTVENCARNGAMWAADPYNGLLSQYADVTSAALADASNLSPQPTVSSASGTAGGRNYYDCTVTYTFTTLSDFSSVQTPFFSVPKSTTIARTVRVYTAPQTPN
jgi:Flp pilus assembly protein TadG